MQETILNTKYRYIDREKSWLSFNARVLQEAADKRVPIVNRIRFLGIFSNNLDEFFRVRYAAIRRIQLSGKSGRKLLGGISADELLYDITDIVIQQQTESMRILSDIKNELQEHNIYIIDENQITPKQHEYIKDFFLQKVSNELVTIMLDDLTEFPLLKDSAGYLAVKLEILKKETVFNKYALVEIPSTINRFVVLPKEGEKHFIIMLDDVIRLNLDNIFTMFNYKNITAHMIKITRDAELDLSGDFGKSLLEKISYGIKERRLGEPVRFVYDKEMDSDTLNFFLDKMKIEAADSLIPGGRYHNRRDYMNFPDLGINNLEYTKLPPLPVKGLSLEGSIIAEIDKKDYLVHTPYQSYSYIIKFLREVALDPKVTTIKITLYRLAKNSQIISSLINAAKNGKKVVVQVELQARFDEESNIKYSKLMEEEGIELIFGIKGLKVHAKACVVERVEGKKIRRYGFISTGNFNESTAKVYTDITLLTSHQKILKEVEKVFEFLNVNYKLQNYKHLIVSPHYTRKKLHKLIDNEIQAALDGKKSYIYLKMNSLTDQNMIDKLYYASQMGVEIRLIVRGICCLIPQIEDFSKNIKAISVVDNFLEHSRIYIFCNEDNPKVYISSADFMGRNIDRRVEISCPIYDKDIKQEVLDIFDISWKSNVKARIHSEMLDNQYIKPIDNEDEFRSQWKMYTYYQEKLQE
ncbi:MAG: polyphosphate kinase 1 [Bacteroidota bacterium]|nr:polyphosphate kinase 1 [Bacteroidota bacterium]